jgi:rhodanese-related sulfurtransferase
VGGNASTGGANPSGGTSVVAGGAPATGGAIAAGGMTNTGGRATGGQSSSGGAGNSTGGSGGCDGTPTLGTVSPAALLTELSQSTRSFLLINVHTPLAGNIPGTDADIVYTDVPAIETFIGSVKSTPVVIYCMSDHMATIAGPQLVADGYCNVRYLSGGLSAWQAAGYPVNP